MKTISKTSFLFPLCLIIYEFCTNMSNDMYLPALPAISHDLSASINLVQLTITTWLAGNTSVQLFVGPLSDRYGRRPILFGGGCLFLLSTIGCALSPSIGFLIISRFIQGVGVCTMMVAGYASIHDLYDDKHAIHILVWMGSAAIIAPAIGPVFGGLILIIANWQAIFYILFLLAFLALTLLWFIMPESISSSDKKTLHIKTLIHTYQSIFSNTSFMTSAISFGLLYGGIIGWITASPFLLIESLNLTSMQFAWLQLPVFGAYILGAQMVKPVLKKIEKDKIIIFGLTLASISGILLIVMSTYFPDNLLSFILPMVGYSIGFGFAAAPLNRVTLTATQEARGAAIAIFYLTMTGSGMLISLILSILNENPISISIIIASSIFLSFILNLIRLRHQKTGSI